MGQSGRASQRKGSWSQALKDEAEPERSRVGAFWIFGVRMGNSERQVSAGEVSCWRKLGLNFIDNRESLKASELRNGVRAKITMMMMIRMMMTIGVGWYLILIECVLFANSFSNCFTHIHVFNPLQPFPGESVIIIPISYTYKSQCNISGCLQ